MAGNVSIVIILPDLWWKLLLLCIRSPQVTGKRFSITLEWAENHLMNSVTDWILHFASRVSGWEMPYHLQEASEITSPSSRDGERSTSVNASIACYVVHEPDPKFWWFGTIWGDKGSLVFLKAECVWSLILHDGFCNSQLELWVTESIIQNQTPDTFSFQKYRWTFVPPRWYQIIKIWGLTHGIGHISRCPQRFVVTTAVVNVVKRP